MTIRNSLGLLDLVDRGAGFIRRRQFSYLPEDGDLYVSPKLVSQHGLRPGDEIEGTEGRPQGRGRAAPLETVTAINGRPPGELRQRPQFASLGAVHPDERLKLDFGLRRGGTPDYTNRVIDLLCPFGKGQRALIVAPAKAGKTMVLQSVAEGVARNHPGATLLILLVKGRVRTSRTVACPEGITRAVVLELCQRHGIPHEVTDLSLTEAYRAEEAFCTGTMGELAAVTTIDGRGIGAGVVGPMTQRLTALFRDLTAHEGTVVA